MPVLNNWQATPPLVLLVGMPADFYTTVDAVRLYDVSERTLRRRIAKGIPGATKNDEGAWLLPAAWLEQFGSRSSEGTDSSTNKSDPATSGMPTGRPTETSSPSIGTPNYPADREQRRISARVIAEATAAQMAKERAEADRIRERRAAAREQGSRTVSGTDNSVAGESGTLSPASDMPTGMPTTSPIGTQLEDLRREKDARIDQLRDQVTDLRVDMAGTKVELKYSEAAVTRVTAERDRATSDLEQARSEAERLRVDLTAEQAARTAEGAAAESVAADKDQEIERQRTKMGELRRELRLAEDQAKRRYRRAKRKQAKRSAKASRKA